MGHKRLKQIASSKVERFGDFDTRTARGRIKSRVLSFSGTFIIPFAKNIRGNSSFFFFSSYKIVKSSDYFNPLELFLFLLALLFSKFSKRARFKNCEGITRRGTFKITTCYDSSRSLKRSRRNE